MGFAKLYDRCGYMREYPVERYFRDARAHTIPGGTSEIHLSISAKELGI